MSYSVIIPFFNEEKTLEIAVQNLLNEDFASETISMVHTKILIG